MKKLILGLLMAMFTLSGCQKENVFQEKENIISIRKTSDSANEGLIDLCDAAEQWGFICNNESHFVEEYFGFGSLMHHEIEINIASFDETGDEFLDGDDPIYSQSNYYGELTAITGGGYHFYERELSGKTIKTVSNPVLHLNANNVLTEGNKITLCQRISKFHDILELKGGPTVDMGLGMGGVFRVTRGDLPPMYFAFPYGAHFWYKQGPDMRVLMQSIINPDLWCDPNELTYDMDVYKYGHGGCEFCDDNTFGLGLEYLVNTDLNALTSYWGDNVISVGFHDWADRIDIENTEIFEADFPPGIGKAEATEPGALLAHLKYLGDGRYEVFDDINYCSSSVSAGDQLTIKVSASFSNSEVIEETRTITLNNNEPLYKHVRVEIRGKIADEYDVWIYYKGIPPCE